MADPERLRRLFAEPGLAWLLERLRQRLRRGQPLAGTVSRRAPSDGERRAFEGLLGRRPGQARALTLRLEHLEERLRHAGLARDLAEATEVLLGAVEDRRARRLAERRRLRRLLDEAARRDRREEVARWLDERRTWVLLRRWGRRPGAAETLLESALGVLSRLPSRRRLLQEVAVEVTGDAHALDPGRRLGTLVIPAVAALGGLSREDDRGDWHDAAGRRHIWSKVGVLTDDLSAPLLVFGLPGRGDGGALDRLLALHHAAADPARLSVRQLRRHDRELCELLAAGDFDRIFVCENPAVVAAAVERLGGARAPLVCLEGQPATAARHFLDAAAAAGLGILYHGDFDWPGLRMANLVVTRHGAGPWRFDTAAYLEAAARHPAGPPLGGKPVAATWDPDLEAAMLQRGVAVHEEAVLDLLLADLVDG